MDLAFNDPSEKIFRADDTSNHALVHEGGAFSGTCQVHSCTGVTLDLPSCELCEIHGAVEPPHSRRPFKNVYCTLGCAGGPLSITVTQAHEHPRAQGAVCFFLIDAPVPSIQHRPNK